MVAFSESAEFVATAADDVELVDNNGPVARLYRSYFLRLGDSGGLRYWIGSGLSLDAISDAFSASSEFQTRYGALSDAQFVDLV